MPLTTDQQERVSELISDLWPGEVRAAKLQVYLRLIDAEPIGVIEMALEELSEVHKSRPTPREVVEMCADVYSRMCAAGFGGPPEPGMGNEPTFSRPSACHLWRESRGLPRLAWFALKGFGIDVGELGEQPEDERRLDIRKALAMAPADPFESQRRARGWTEAQKEQAIDHAQAKQ